MNERGKSQPYTRAALTVRGATIRSQKHQVMTPLQGFIEDVFQPYGISSNMFNFATFREQVVNRFGEDKHNAKRANIQMDADHRIIVDLEEWMIGEQTESAIAAGLPVEVFVQDGWAKCVEAYRRTHEETHDWTWANEVFRCGLGNLQARIAGLIQAAHRANYEAGAWDEPFLHVLRELAKPASETCSGGDGQCPNQD
eukprot:2029523-Amphidinium_carterae.1